MTINKNIFADTTQYSYQKTEFAEYIKWSTVHPAKCDLEPEFYQVIKYAIEHEKTKDKFLGVKLGSQPYQNWEVQKAAEDFIWQLGKYKEHQASCWLGGKMNDRVFAADRENGCRDGYWLQPKSSQSAGYEYGYLEGVSLKRSEGYTIKIGSDGQAYLWP
jgi:hypothetical protein